MDSSHHPDAQGAAFEAEQPGLRSAMLATSRSILAAQQRAERELLEARDALQRQNRALAAANSILEATLNATPVGVLVSDREGEVGMRNRRFDDLWPSQSASPTARRLDEMVVHIGARLAQPDVFHAWSMQVHENPDGEYGLQCETTDGRHLHCQALPQRQGDQVVGVVYNWLDVTERVQSETLRSQVRAAEMAAKEQSAFISRASHELRTPLNAVLGFSQLLQLNPKVSGDAQLAPQVGHIRTAGEHLRALMDDLLQLSRLEMGAVSLKIEPLNLADILREAVALVSPQAAVRSLRVDAVPEGPAWVLGDGVRVRQVLLNLLSNAVKYNSPGGRLGLVLSEQGPHWQLAIADEGQGMSARQLAHLFEPFNRLGAERTATEGTGLGLVITRHLMQAMQGFIKAHSALDQGAVFTLGLLRADPPPA